MATTAWSEDTQHVSCSRSPASPLAASASTAAKRLGRAASSAARAGDARTSTGQVASWPRR